MNPGAIVVDGALWVAIPVAVLAGLLSFLSPCVLPLVPGYLGFIGGSVGADASALDARTTRRGARVDVAGSGSSDSGAATSGAAVAVRDTGRARLLGGVALFIAGFTLVFVAMTVLGGVLGQFFLEYQDTITRVMGVIVILLGLVFIGVFGFAQRTVRPHLRGNLGLIGAPLLGIAMGIGWTPCIGPTLGTILALSWNLGDPWRAALLGIAYSLGLGIPFLLIALGLGWASRSMAFLKRHIRAVNIIGGAMLVALGVLMVTGVWTDLMSQLQAVMGSVDLPL